VEDLVKRLASFLAKYRGMRAVLSEKIRLDAIARMNVWTSGKLVGGVRGWVTGGVGR
jgi:hypothetical protein